jgi:hypothetical protein
MSDFVRDLPGLALSAAAGSLGALLILGMLGTAAPDEVLQSEAWTQEHDRAGRLRRSPEEPVICWPEADGTLGCWPDEIEQLPGFPDGDDYEQVKVARTHLCARSSDLRIDCFGWGDCIHGQCDSPDGSFIGFNVGAVANCARRVDGAVHCWGSDSLEEP